MRCNDGTLFSIADRLRQRMSSTEETSAVPTSIAEAHGRRETLSNCKGDDVTCYQLSASDKGFAAAAAAATTTRERVSQGERQKLSSRYRLICTNRQRGVFTRSIRSEDYPAEYRMNTNRRRVLLLFFRSISDNDNVDAETIGDVGRSRRYFS